VITAGEIVELGPGAVAVLCPKPTSRTGVVAMVALCGDGVVIVDSGKAEYMPDALVPALTKLDAGLTDVVALCSTHGHQDHVGGNAALAKVSGAPTFYCADDTDLAGTPPDIPIADGDLIVRGGIELRVLATPGHTPGSVCFYEPSRRLLIAGDAAQGMGYSGALPVYYQSGRQYRASLRKLQTLAIDTLVLGHPVRWAGQTHYVARGADCARLLAESLAVSTAIGRVARQVWRTSATRDVGTLCTKVTDGLSRSTELGRFAPAQPLEPDTIETIRSEFRDLGS
jgi:glyoxylase-like metal-dependent hydrolase (beta-lactamase superfamily II)